ncbi:cupin domain-containing protein [Streptomyces flavidovirens]|uniref:cupin domain-containing protein n=1 Tax=Streptomyces flavidovirens TaxID=67298 RepID=UPI00055F9AF0|nr:cupin domain-containing protein [Streptomyces flavidovirens]
MSETHAHKQVRIVHSKDLNSQTLQTPGLLREVAFEGEDSGPVQLSAFRSTVKPGAATGAHHHEDQETVLYVVSGTAHYRWGDRLENVAEAGPGDFVFIPPYVVHQEINRSTDLETVWAVVRSGMKGKVTNLPDLDKYGEKPKINYTAAE